MTIQSLTADGFKNDILAGNGVQAIRFWAEWCGPCRMMKPIYQKLAENFGDTITFYDVNIDLSPEIASACGIASIPNLMIFKDGNVVDQMVGLAPQSTYERLLSQYTNPNNTA